MTVMSDRFLRWRWCAERIKLDAMKIGDVEVFPYSKMDLIRLTCYRLQHAYETREYKRKKVGEEYVVTRIK